MGVRVERKVGPGVVGVRDWATGEVCGGPGCGGVEEGNIAPPAAVLAGWFMLGDSGSGESGREMM
jgi:hypothetical protein